MTKSKAQQSSTDYPGSQRRRVQHWSDNGIASIDDKLAEECPIALVYNGISHAVMMASPHDIEDFAFGFSLSEGIITGASDIYAIESQMTDRGVVVDITLSSHRFSHLKQRRRNLAGTTGCGLCGTQALDQVDIPSPAVTDNTPIAHQAIQVALAQLHNWQPLQFDTGAVHAATWCDINGNIIDSREDVGRHNALDKLTGHRLQQTKLTPGFVVVSSRASYEMVQKAAFANIGVLVAVSAATSLAVDYAEKLNVTLVGFGRSGRHVVYTHPCRLIQGVL